MATETVPGPAARGPGPARRQRLRLGTGPLAAGCALAAVALSVDAIVRTPGDFDYGVIRAVRRLDPPAIEAILRFVSHATGSFWAPILWFATLCALAVARRWLAATLMLVFPLAGGVNWIVRLLVGQTRPALEESDGLGAGTVARGLAENDFQSFPSGHVLGALLLYGFVFSLAGVLRPAAFRWTIRSGCVAVVVLTGLARVWLAAHWPGDVLVAYAFGGLWLTAVVVARRQMAPYAGTVALLRAPPLPLESDVPGHRRVQALTSTVLLEGDTVTKAYWPGYVPRLLYWLAFQAPFGYAYNRLALEAAVNRRNLAGRLTEYWYGENRVAPALGVTERDGYLALAGRFSEGSEPQDHRRARAFLDDLARRFDAAGLPTWQVDPRQPRALGNLLETPAGQYVVIDLESGVVSPLASPRAWWRAIRRAQVPIYDDVFFDVTRAYVARESAQIAATRGEAWLRSLDEAVARAEAAQRAWHASEPRFWSRAVRLFWSGFGLARVLPWLRQKSATGRVRGEAWLDDAITRWERDGHLDADRAQGARAALHDPRLQAVIPHFGVHLAIGVALRFPLGVIARVAYTLGNLLLATGRLAIRRIDRHEWRRAAGIHSPLVLVVAALPGVGTFAYLASAPVLSNRLVLRLALDAVGEKLPFAMYRRLGLRRLVLPRPASNRRPGRGLVRLHDTVLPWVPRLAHGVSGIGLIVFVVLALARGFPRSLEEEPWEVRAQIAALAAIGVGWALTWRWEGLGGALILIAANALGALASIAFPPHNALLASEVFAIPGMLFLLHWQHHRPPLQLVGLLAGIGLVLAGGGLASVRTYDYYFGPTHPSSKTPAIPVDVAEWVWSGAVTTGGFTVKARLEDDDAEPELLVARTSSLEDAVRFPPQPRTRHEQDVVAFTATGLEPGTPYHYALLAGGRVDRGRSGRVRTLPAGPASFTFALGSCARTGSNGAVFDRIREANPLFWLVPGDFHYDNIGTNDERRFRTAYHRNLSQPAQQALLLETPIVYVWDDHDFGGNNADRTARSRRAARAVYREAVPHYPLPAGDGDAAIYQAFSVGRARFIVLDSRSERDPASQNDDAGKSMLGEAQKAWLKEELLAANGRFPLIVLVTSVPWIAKQQAGADHWGGYATERRELADFIAANGVRGVVIVSGDAHMLAMDSGVNSDYSSHGGAALPVLHAAALDRRGSVKGGPYSAGARSGSGQFALMTVTDLGAGIEVSWSGRDYRGAEKLSYRFLVPASTP